MDEVDINNLSNVQFALWAFLIKHKLTPSDAQSWAQDTTKIIPVAESWRTQTKRTDSNEEIKNMSTGILRMAVKQGLLRLSPDGAQVWDESVSSCTSPKQLRDSIHASNTKTTQSATKEQQKKDNQQKGKGPKNPAKAKTTTPAPKNTQVSNPGASIVKTATQTQQQDVDKAAKPINPDPAGHTPPVHDTSADKVAAATANAPATIMSPPKSQNSKQEPELDMQHNLEEQGKLLMLLAAGKLDNHGNSRLQQLQTEFQAATKTDTTEAAPAGRNDGPS